MKKHSTPNGATGPTSGMIHNFLRLREDYASRYKENSIDSQILDKTLQGSVQMSNLVSGNVTARYMSMEADTARYLYAS